MTATSESIEQFALEVRFTTASEVKRRILEPLQRDTSRGATVATLIGSGTAERLARALSGDRLVAFLELVGGATDQTGVARLRRALWDRPPWLTWVLGLSFELHLNYRRLGITRLAAPESTVTAVVVTNPGAPFTGVGATGVSPRDVDVPLADQFRMLMGDRKTIQRYGSPSVKNYVSTLTPGQRRGQAEILKQLPITSAIPHSYAELPSRLSVMAAAARVHNLHAELIAAFILAEQRDQSQLEDGKDSTAATSLVSANTSIGLGRIVVSTAKRHDLFSDLLSAPFRCNLTHTQIAFLLTSDEFNIFGVAKYLRLTADAGAAKDPASLPETKRRYPDIDLPAYRQNSRMWPVGNIKALGSEYTTSPWDDVISWGWGEIVYEAYLDLMGLRGWVSR